MTQQISPQTISVNGVEPTMVSNTDTYMVVDLRNDSKPTRGNRRILWLKNATGGAITVFVGFGEEDVGGDSDGTDATPLSSGSTVPTVGILGYSQIALDNNEEMLLGPFDDRVRAGWTIYDDSMLVYKSGGADANFSIAWFELPA